LPLFLPLPLPFLLVIPAGDLLLLALANPNRHLQQQQSLTTFFFENSPKTACQAPQPGKSIPKTP
jgi:hypothetical protein